MVLPPDCRGLPSCLSTFVNWIRSGLRRSWRGVRTSRAVQAGTVPDWHIARKARRQTGTVRLSPGPFTKMSEIDTALAVVAELA